MRVCVDDFDFVVEEFAPVSACVSEREIIHLCRHVDMAYSLAVTSCQVVDSHSHVHVGEEGERSVVIEWRLAAALLP